MTLNTHDFPAEQDRIAVETDGGVVHYFTPAAPRRCTGKGEPVAALDQIFGYYEA